jgi:hypothetical protein
MFNEEFTTNWYTIFFVKIISNYQPGNHIFLKLFSLLFKALFFYSIKLDHFSKTKKDPTKGFWQKEFIPAFKIPGLFYRNGERNDYSIGGMC